MEQVTGTDQQATEHRSETKVSDGRQEAELLVAERTMRFLLAWPVVAFDNRRQVDETKVSSHQQAALQAARVVAGDTSTTGVRRGQVLVSLAQVAS